MLLQIAGFLIAISPIVIIFQLGTIVSLLREIVRRLPPRS